MLHPYQIPVLHRVPAGHRLDFATPAGCCADVYRQLGTQPWTCIARHACSPCLDRAVQQHTPGYYVQYRNAQGAAVGRSAVVLAVPEGLPSPTCWLHLS